MKIAIFHELDYGGARRVVSEFTKRLSKVSDIDLYYVDDREDIEIKKFAKQTFYYPFSAKKWKGNKWTVKLYKDTLELLRIYNLHRKISEDIKSKRYDYIFVHPSKFTQAPFLLSFLKNKCIYFCQEPLRIIYDKVLSDLSFVKFPKKIYEIIIRKIRKKIDLKNIKNASLILANSNYSKKFIEKSYKLNAKVCNLGVDENLFRQLNVQKTIDILYMGNKDRGFDLLNESLKLFKTQPKVYSIFRENGKQNISDEELVVIFNKSKVLVALNQNEPFGLIPLEAMACETPVLAIREGGYVESVIDGETGFLISRDPKELYHKLYKLINDEKLRNKMGKFSRENILENWTWKKSVNRFLKIIRYAN